MKGQEVVRMVPWKDGQANRGHSCVKGRFAWGYATHEDRMLKPMIRGSIADPWREVSWEEALTYAASEIKRIQAKYGTNSVGGLTSSRCTNEETRSEEHTSELQSLMRNSYDVFCLKKKTKNHQNNTRD